MQRRMVMRAAWCAGGAVLIAGTLCAFQRPFREYPGIEYNDFPLPADYQEKTEYVFARLMYPQYPGVRGGFGFRGAADWKHVKSMCQQHYPGSSRQVRVARRRING